MTLKAKPLLVGACLVLAVFLLSSGVAQLSIDDSVDSTRFYDDEYYRDKGGIFVDKMAAPLSVGLTPVSFKWGYNVENVSSARVSTREEPFNLLVPFWFEHQFAVQPDPCAGDLNFVSSMPAAEICTAEYSYDVNHGDENSPGDGVVTRVYEGESCVKQVVTSCSRVCGAWDVNADANNSLYCSRVDETCKTEPKIDDHVEILHDYNLLQPLYDYGQDSAECDEAVDADHCYIGAQVVHCDVGLKDNECIWTSRTPNGLYDYIPKQKWLALSELETCPLQPNRLYNFRHAATAPAGTSILFDVNVVIDLPSVDRFAVSIPEPKWTSTLEADFTNGWAYDFNHTKITVDGNVMPDGEIQIPDLTLPGGGLIGYWKLDKNVSSVAADSSGRGNNGTWVNESDANGSWFFEQNAADFDGIDQHVIIPDNDLYSFTDESGTPTSANDKPFSVSAWVYSTDKDIGGTIIAKYDSSGNDREWRLIISSDDLRFTMWNYNQDEVAGYIGRQLADITDAEYSRQWMHLAGTYDGSNTSDGIKLYRNGVRVDTSDYEEAGYNGMTNRSQAPSIGTIWNGSSTSAEWDGQIAEAKIFNRELSQSEIANEYRRNLDGNGLVAYYSFNDTNSDGSGIEDRAGGDNNGVMINGADINAAGMWDTNAGFFDGVDDLVHFPSLDASGSDLSADFTAIGWIKPIVGADQVFFSKSEDASWTTDDKAFSINEDSGSNYLQWNVHSEGTVNGSTDIQSNEWYHIAITHDDGENDIYLYLNGTIDGNDASFTNPADQSNTVFKIGARGGSQEFKGQIDEFKFYDRVLSTDEIRADYNAWMTSASYTSPVFAAKATAEWYTVGLDGTDDPNNSMTIDYRTCDNNACSTADGFTEGLSGEGVDHVMTEDHNRFFQYRLNLDTNSADWDPARVDVLDYGVYAEATQVEVDYNQCVISGDVNWSRTLKTGFTCLVEASFAVENSAELTLQPGVVLKYMDSTLMTVNDGGLITIDNGGSDTNKVHFTSCNDPTNGENLTDLEGCVGDANATDYVSAMFLATGAGDHSAKNLHDLNISFAITGLDLDIDINSVHDCNIQNNHNDEGLNSGLGGAMYVTTAVTMIALYNNTFRDNSTNDGGGAVYMSSTGHIEDIHHNFFVNNWSAASGGGLNQDGIVTSIRNNVFKDNNGGAAGAGLLSTKILTNLNDNNFIHNGCWSGNGGAVSIASGDTITNVFNNGFSRNWSGQGGAFYSAGDATTNFYNNFFIDNYTTNDGGALRNAGGITNFYNNTLVNNAAAVDGGGYSQISVVTNFYGNTIVGNAARGGEGGGAHLEGSGSTNMYDNNISNNTSTGVGGGLDFSSVQGNVYDNNITNNATSGGSGGGINAEQDITNFYGNRVTGNTTVSGGGGGMLQGGASEILKFYDNVFMRNDNGGGRGAGLNQNGGGDINEMYNNQFLWNTNADDGGAIYFRGRIGSLYNNVFVGNTASSEGDGIYCRSSGCNIYNVYNNVFAFHEIAIEDDNATSMAKYQNNIFVENTTAMLIAGSTFTENYNAFWSNDTNCSGACGVNDQNFTDFPFLGDNSDLNWSIITSQYGIVTDTGTDDGNNEYFAERTVRQDEAADTGTRDIGYHYYPATTGEPVEDSCDCPASGWWEIVSGDHCKLEALCDLVSGGMHVADGALEVASNGILSIPSGFRVIINKASGRLDVERGGRVVQEK